MIYRKPRLALLLLSALISGVILSCSALANLPNPFATATPTATATSTPTITPSPTPTFTPTPTPVPTGIAIRDVPGGSSRFYDYDAGYTIDIPAEWIPVQLDQKDIADAISRLGDSYPGIADALRASGGAKSSLFRIIAYDKLPEHYTPGFVANFTVGMYQDRTSASMPLDFLVKVLLDQVQKQMPGAKTHQLETVKNVHGVPVGSTEVDLSVPLPSSSRLPVHEKQLYFQTRTAFVMITFTAAKSNAQAIQPSFEKIVDGIQLLEP